VREGAVTSREVTGGLREPLNLPLQDTHYTVSLQAHNKGGLSEANTIIVRTRSGEKSEDILVAGVDLPLLPIAALLILFLLILLFLLDLACYRLRQRGATYLLCQKVRQCRKLGGRGGRGVPRGQTVSSSRPRIDDGGGKRGSQVTVDSRGGGRTSLYKGGNFPV